MKGIYLILILLSSTTCMHAQDLMQVRRGVFSDGESEGKLHTFRDRFQNNKECVKRFDRFDRARKAHKIVNYSALGLAGVTVMSGIVLSMTEDNTSPNINNELNGAILIVSGIGSGLAIWGMGSMFAIPIKNFRKRQLLSNCREDVISSVESPKLNLVVGVNGMGLAYHF